VKPGQCVPFVAGDAGALAAGSGALLAEAAEGVTTSTSSLWFASHSHVLLGSMPLPCLMARSDAGAKPSWLPIVVQTFATHEPAHALVALF
jgi:hypothetical protein